MSAEEVCPLIFMLVSTCTAEQSTFPSPDFWSNAVAEDILILLLLDAIKRSLPPLRKSKPVTVQAPVAKDFFIVRVDLIRSVAASQIWTRPLL